MRAMKSPSNRSKLVSFGLAILALAGFAIQNATATSEPQAAVSLAYKFQEGKALTYQVTSTQTQNLDMMGQTISTETTSAIEFVLQPKGMKDGQYQLGVTINAFKVEAQSPQGAMTADSSTVIGKSFDMVVSKLGKESDLSGASAIRYTVGIAGTRDLGSSFQAIFPDFPDKPLKVGDSWPNEDSVTQKSDAGDILVNIKSVNTLDGFETVDGFECARIKGPVTAKLSGTLDQQGMSLVLDGKVEGTQTWYFALKEGILVKVGSKTATSGSITAGDPANMSIPMSGETKSEIRLVKK